MKKSFKKCFFVVFIAVFLASCATSMGRKFDTSYVNKIERGVTTKADVRKNIGEPGSVTFTSHGENWSYHYSPGINVIDIYAAQLGGDGLSASTSTLAVTFKGDVVSDYTFSKSQ